MYKYILCKKYIIVITHTNYVISYINVFNDLCLYTKRPYTFPHLYNATLYYKFIFYSVRSFFASGKTRKIAELERVIVMTAAAFPRPLLE